MRDWLELGCLALICLIAVSVIAWVIAEVAR